jgi:ligand-binding sensor domain-containing protein
LKLSTSNRVWTSSVSSVIYQGQEVVDFDVFKNDFFIATADMLIHFDKKNNLPLYFNYNFLTNINKLKVNSRKLWIGTSEGIVSYRYK